MFPLPSGVCRKVCRPLRDPPRLVTPKDAARMARAAARRSPVCEVLGAVYSALESPEAGHASMVEEGIDALDERLDALDTALRVLAQDIAGIRVTDIPEDETTLQKWLRRAKIAMRVGAIIDDLVEIFRSYVAMREVLRELMRNVGLMIQCLRGGESDSQNGGEE